MDSYTETEKTPPPAAPPISLPDSSASRAGVQMAVDTATESRRSVVAFVPSRIRERIGNSILARRHLHTACFSDELEAVQSIIKDPPRLVLIYDSGRARELLERMFKAYPTANFPVVVLSELPQNDFPPQVKACLPVDCDVQQLDRVVAELLGLPTRKSSRILVRVGLNLSSSPNGSSLATSVDISAGGMLLQCNQELTVGQLYQVELLGLPHATVPALDLRITRHAEAPRAGSRLFRYAGRFEGIDLHTMERLIEDILP